MLDVPPVDNLTNDRQERPCFHAWPSPRCFFQDLAGSADPSPQAPHFRDPQARSSVKSGCKTTQKPSGMSVFPPSVIEVVARPGYSQSRKHPFQVADSADHDHHRDNEEGGASNHKVRSPEKVPVTGTHRMGCRHGYWRFSFRLSSASRAPRSCGSDASAKRNSRAASSLLPWPRNTRPKL